MWCRSIHLFLLADKDVSCAERCSGVDLCGDADTGAFPAPGHSAITMEVRRYVVQGDAGADAAMLGDILRAAKSC